MAMPLAKRRSLPPPRPRPGVLTVPLVLLTLVATGWVEYLPAPAGPAGAAQFLLLALLALGLGLALGLLISQGLLARLRLFAQVSGELAAGNLAQRLPTNSRISEFNALAQSFNQMADQMQQSLQRMQTTLAESEAKFTTIFRSSPDSMAIATRAEGRLLDVNHSLLEFFGYRREEMVGHTALDLSLWADLSQRDRYRTRLDQEGRVRDLEVQLLTKGGETKTVLLSAEAQTLEGQDCLIVTHRDITDRKQIELALQESETRFRQLAEAVQEGFFVYDIETAHYAYVNPSYWKIRDIDPDYSPKGEARWLACIHPDDRDRIVAALARERQGENFDQEYRYITSGGELRWLRSKAFPLFNEAGRVVRVVGTLENITESKRTEAALRQSEARFRSAFDDAPYGISLVSPTGRFVLANPYYCNLLGYTEAELITFSFKDITHPDDWADDWGGFQRMMAGETRTYQREKRYLTKQGEVIPVVVNAAVIYDSAGHPLYSVGHVQDIRDRLAIDRMKDEFISVVSHELRTPITSIQGALVLLGAGVYADRPEKAQRMLEIAINNSDRLVRLVNDILSFERLESGQVQLEKETCQLPSLLYKAIDSVQPLADHSGITIALTPLQVTLWAAPDAIIQVLTNLLSNAIKFSGPGGTVWLKAEEYLVSSTSPPPYSFPASPTGSALPHLLLTVRDHGRGIPLDKQERIFEQFQQVDASDSRHHGGTGLGLAICKQIVQQHRGQIWVESAVGTGSIFSVALPLETEGRDD